MKRKIIAIRPFHMANFSSGAMQAIFAFTLIMPFVLFIPMAALLAGINWSVKKKGSTSRLDKKTILDSANHIALPACVLIFIIPSLLFAVHSLRNGYEGGLAFAFLTLIIPTASIYYSLMSSAAFVRADKKSRWMLAACGFLLLCMIASVIMAWPLAMLAELLLPVGYWIIAFVSLAVVVYAYFFFRRLSQNKQENHSLEQANSQMLCQQQSMDREDPRQSTEDLRELFSDVESRES